MWFRKSSLVIHFKYSIWSTKIYLLSPPIMGRIYFLPSLILALVMWFAFTMELLIELTNRDSKCAEHLCFNLQGKKKKILGCFWPDPQHKTYWEDPSSTCSLKHNYILNHTSANLEIHEGKCAYLSPWDFCICLLHRKADKYTVTFISSNLTDFLFDWYCHLRDTK